jgi:hypothetical protein
MQHACDLFLAQAALADEQRGLPLRGLRPDELFQFGDMRAGADETFVVVERKRARRAY